MAEPRSRIKVTAPAQSAAVVTIYQANGSTAAAAFTTEGGATSATLPATLTAGTSGTYYVQDGQQYVVSVTIGGTEYANGYGQTWSGTVSNDGVVIAPVISGSSGSADWSTAQSVNAQTGTTYTLVAGDAGKLVTLSNASAITLTVPQDSDATISIGTYVDLYQLGAGQVTVAAGTGATLRVSGLTAKARAQYSRLTVQKVSANTWVLMGDLAVA